MPRGRPRKYPVEQATSQKKEYYCAKCKVEPIKNMQEYILETIPDKIICRKCLNMSSTTHD